MTNPRDPEALLAAYLDDGMTVLPDRIVDSVLDEVHRTPQRALPRPWATRSLFRNALSAAAAVALVVVGGALLYQRSLDIAGPSPTAEASASPSQPPVVITPTPTEEVLSLDLAWTEVDIEAGFGRVAWLNDRFVLVDSSGAVRTSSDGLSWGVLQPGDPDPGYADLLGEYATLVTWEDDIVGWWNPEDGREFAGAPSITARDILRIVRPGAEPIETSPFEGRILWIAVGPAGFVAKTHVHDEDSSETFTWFSPDGSAWTATTGFDEAVGVSDGFIARGEGLEECSLTDVCNWMWHSADGLAWRNLGPADPATSPARLMPWKGGALFTDGSGRFDLWTSEGYRELPMDADFPAPVDGADPVDAPFAVGALGLVSIRLDSLESLVTRDGVDWKVQPIPAAMQTDSDYFRPPNIAVGDRSVAYLTWSGYWGEGEGYIPTLWVGSFEP